MVADNHKSNDNASKKKSRASQLGLSSKEKFRQSEVIDEHATFLIVCEGELSEPNYLNWLRKRWAIPTAKVEIIPKGGDPLGIVELAVDKGFSKKGKASRKLYDHVWAVFDKDDVVPHRLGAAFSLAQDKGVEIAFSNEAFELWYLLHFRFQNTPIGRHDLEKALSQYLSMEYKKKLTSFFETLASRLKDAIRNAQRLEKSAHHNPYPENPYTGIYKLVIRLASNASITLPSVLLDISSSGLKRE